MRSFDSSLWAVLFSQFTNLISSWLRNQISTCARFAVDKLCITLWKFSISDCVADERDDWGRLWKFLSNKAFWTESDLWTTLFSDSIFLSSALSRRWLAKNWAMSLAFEKSGELSAIQFELLSSWLDDNSHVWLFVHQRLCCWTDNFLESTQDSLDSRMLLIAVISSV